MKYDKHQKNALISCMVQFALAFPLFFLADNPNMMNEGLKCRLGKKNKNTLLMQVKQ